jgi:pyrroline-5-carboxylate reductase
MRKVKVGFIGFGRMGSVIADRALRMKQFRKSDVNAYAPSAKTQAALRKRGIRVEKSAANVVKKSRFVWLCVKPQKMADVLAEIKKAGAVSGKCFVSIAAGVPIARLEKALGRVAVVRVMPNTPSLLGAGMSGVSRGRFAGASDEKWVKTILSSLGDVVSVKEASMHAVTAVSGSGPAYVFYLAEMLSAAAKKLGLNEALAARLVRETIFGAGRMLKETGVDAYELRRQVTSPGGTTAAAIGEFEKRNLKTIVESALKKAVKRSKELSRAQ